MIDKVHLEKNAIAPNCNACAMPCGSTEDYDMNLLWNEDEDIRSLKSLILFAESNSVPSKSNAASLTSSYPSPLYHIYPIFSAIHAS